MTAQTHSVESAIEKPLRDHELPIHIAAFIIVTEHFSYLVDDLHWDQGNGKQPSILLHGPAIYNAINEQQDSNDELIECFSGVALYQEEVVITGLIRESGIGAFERQMYRIDKLEILLEDSSLILDHLEF